MRIVYMGTPEFAVPCLSRLVEDSHEVAGVFTQPDKPRGRKAILTPPEVKVRALELGIPVFQPRTLRDTESYELLKSLNPELVVVVAYGKILPPEILELPKYGCINIHASLLPKYRGAAPIQWSVINGESETGVTSMYMDIGIDTGDMLLSQSVKIGENETAGELHDRLSALGAQVLSDTLRELENGTLEPKKQDSSLSTHAPILDKSLSEIDWSSDAGTIHNKIRGLNPWPSAQTALDGKTLKIHSSQVADGFSGKPGEILAADKTLIIGCGSDTALKLIEVQYEGSKRMSAEDFLRGHKLKTGIIL
ncbi:MAG: methionyl-tRNA formyltransferase [Clostridiales bacterium]|nr:methionyl-tRNA formyltransferase [Clostridiales bacterium]